MTISYAYQIGLGFIGLMVMQALALAFLPGKTWEARAMRCRWHEWIALAVVAVCLLFLLGGVKSASAAAGATSGAPTGAEFRFESVFTVFMLGLLRSALDVRLPKLAKKPRGLWDAFLIGVAVSLLVDVITDGKDSFTHIFQADVTTLKGFGAVALAAGTYLAWIYSLLVRQMTLVENFSGPVVNRFLLKSLLPEVPLQIVMIGPKKAGKSKITASVTEFKWEELRDTGVPVMGSFLTRLNNAKRTRVVGSVVDTPGENMGQHLAAAINFRTDALTLVLNSLAFDKTKVNETTFVQLRQFATEAFLPTAMSAKVDVAQGSRDYLRNLEVATKGSDQPGSVQDLAQIYKVHSLSVVIYNEAKVDFADKGKSNLKLLADEVGKLFGLKPESCDFAILDVTRDGSVESKAFTDAVAGLALRR
jgi:hypothetical protein